MRVWIVMAIWAALGTAQARADLYENFADLAAHETEGEDYAIELTDRSAPITVLAIHGGKIEPGTTEMARLISGTDWNLYSFMGIRPGSNSDLHVTSHHFDEPMAVALAERSDRCVSMHGFWAENGVVAACIGGGNRAMARAVAEGIAQSGLPITVEYPCEAWGGVDRMNIVNRCQRKGVQVEMSYALRRQLLRDPRLARKLADAIKRAARR